MSAARNDRRLQSKERRLQYTCKACGKVVCIMPESFAKKHPKGAKAMLDGAGARHRAKDRCGGKIEEGSAA